MTTATMVTGTLTTQTGVRPRRSLEELVDRLMATLTFRHEPATAAANSLEGAMPVSTSRSQTMTQTMRTAIGPRRSLEELVDRLMAALTFREEPESPVGRDSAEVDAVDTSKGHSVSRAIHEARRLRQAADLDGALEVLAGAVMTHDDPNLARWAHSEWGAACERGGSYSGSVLVYNQGTGRAAALAPRAEGGMLEVVAALGMRWRPGKIVSRRSLRGLRPLTGGASWS